MTYQIVNNNKKPFNDVTKVSFRIKFPDKFRGCPEICFEFPKNQNDQYFKNAHSVE